MSILWAAPFLVIISNEDKQFNWLIFKEAHVLQLPNSHGGDLHLPQHSTINRVLSSPICPVFIPDLRREISAFIRNYMYCQKQLARGGKLKSYYHVLQDPWISIKMQNFDV